MKVFVEDASVQAEEEAAVQCGVQELVRHRGRAVGPLAARVHAHLGINR